MSGSQVALMLVGVAAIAAAGVVVVEMTHRKPAPAPAPAPSSSAKTNGGTSSTDQLVALANGLLGAYGTYEKNKGA